MKPLLGVLLVAQQPLTVWQLRTILDLEDDQVRDGLQRLGGLVTDAQQRYSLYHLKLRDYLQQDEARPAKRYLFARDEEEAYHEKLVQWCEREPMRVIWQDTRDRHEQGRREYARHHYVTHLYLSHRWDRLFAVLDEGSYGHAKWRYDRSGRLYVQDLKRGSLAASREGWTFEEGVGQLPRLWQYALLRCSLHSIADNYPSELFQVMLELGREQEVLGLIELLTDPRRKVERLCLLAGWVIRQPERKREGTAIFRRAEEAVRGITDEGMRAEALVKVAEALVQAGERERAEGVARGIRDRYWWAEVLVKVAEVLWQAGERERAEAVACSIADQYQQERALAELAERLAQAGEWERAYSLVTQARSLARRNDPFNGMREEVMIFTSFAAVLAQTQQYDHLFPLIQQEWQRVETRDEAFEYFSPVLGLVHYRPELGVELWHGFQWVTRWLEGTSGN